MYELLCSHQRTVPDIGQPACDLSHPCAIGVVCNTHKLYPATIEFDDKAHEIPYQGARVRTSSLKKSVATIAPNAPSRTFATTSRCRAAYV
jgi:hypothetical protein